MQQKTIVLNGVNYMNYNSSYSKQWRMENIHPAIISKELDTKVKAMREAKKKIEKRNMPKIEYSFSGLIKCGCCGKNYMHKVQNPKKAWATEIWICGKANTYGTKACGNHRIKDSVIKEKFVECYNEFVKDKTKGDDVERLALALRYELDNEKELNVLKTRRLITEENYNIELKEILTKIKEIEKQISKVDKKLSLSEYSQIEEFNETKLKKFITKVIVQNRTVTFEFYNGAKISKGYSNGQSGNKNGWLVKKEGLCNNKE